MKKILFLLSGLFLSGSHTQAASQVLPNGIIIKHDNKFLVLERGVPKAQDKLFACYQGFDGKNHWCQIDGSGGDIFKGIYIVKDTIKTISPLANSEQAYEIWKNGPITQKQSYGQKYNSWLTQGNYKSAKTVVHYAKSDKEIKGYRIEENQSRFALENVILFLSLLLFGIKIRNVFNNYGAADIGPILMFHLLISIAALICFDVFGGAEKILILVLVFSSVFVAMARRRWTVTLRLRDIKTRARWGMTTILSASIVSGLILGISTGSWWQFPVLTLIAGILAYFFPFWKGKFNSQKNFSWES